MRRTGGVWLFLLSRHLPRALGGAVRRYEPRAERRAERVSGADDLISAEHLALHSADDLVSAERRAERVARPGADDFVAAELGAGAGVFVAQVELLRLRRERGAAQRAPGQCYRVSTHRYTIENSRHV